MFNNHQDNELLFFREDYMDELRTTSNRVRRLAPQIDRYLKDGYGWPVIHKSLEALGIHLKMQSIKNLVSSCRNEMNAGGTNAHPSCVELENSRARPRNL